MIIQPLFSTFFCVFKNINLNHNAILKELDKVNYRPVEDSSKTSMSKSIKLLDDIKYGSKIKKVVDEHMQETIKKLDYDIKHQLVNSWATRTPPNQEGQYHLHNNFWLSAVYYPHGEQIDDFRLEFKSDRLDFSHFDIPIKNFNIINSSIWDIPVGKGDLIIFPALLKHKIKKNYSKQIRYSIAMNFLPLGKIGASDGAMEYKKW